METNIPAPTPGNPDQRTFTPRSFSLRNYFPQVPQSLLAPNFDVVGFTMPSSGELKHTSTLSSPTSADCLDVHSSTSTAVKPPPPLDSVLQSQIDPLVSTLDHFSHQRCLALIWTLFLLSTIDFLALFLACLMLMLFSALPIMWFPYLYTTENTLQDFFNSN